MPTLEGRLLAQILNNTPKNYPGVLGTGIVKLPELNCARTGLSEKVARDDWLRCRNCNGSR